MITRVKVVARLTVVTVKLIRHYVSGMLTVALLKHNLSNVKIEFLLVKNARKLVL